MTATQFFSAGKLWVGWSGGNYINIVFNLLQCVTEKNGN